MNRKGFSLIELMACLALLGIVLCIGLYVTRGTLSTALSTITGVTVNEIYDAAELYVVENSTKWINDGEEYTCLTVSDLVDYGYFDDDEINTYKDSMIRVVRDSKTRVIESVRMVDICE